MPGQTLTTAAEVLKEDYKGPIAEQLNNSNITLAYVERNTDDVVGKRAFVPIHVTRNSGVGARAEGGTLPTAGNQGYKDVLVPLRYNYGRIQVSGPSIRAMASDRGSFIRSVKGETKGVLADLKRDVNRQIWGTSNGVLATCGTTSASTTLVLAVNTSEVQLRQLEESKIVDVGTIAAPTTVATGLTVSAVTRATTPGSTAPNITVSAAVTTTASHRVFTTGAGGASDNTGSNNDGQKEMTGFQTMISDTAIYLTLDPATVTKWKATVNENTTTNRSFTEALLSNAIMATQIAGDGTPNLIFTDDGAHRAYANNLTALKRFPNTIALKGGYSGVDVSTAAPGQEGGKVTALVWERDVPTGGFNGASTINGQAWGVDTDKIQLYQSSDWEFMDEDGAMLSRVSGVDAYEATLFKYAELATTERNAHFLLTDLTTA